MGKGLIKLNSQVELWNKLNESNTLQEVQQYIKGNYDQFNRKKFTLDIKEKEVELAIKPNNWEDMEEFFFDNIPNIDKNKINHYDTIESEVADVFIVLSSVCNKLDIDLYKAIKDKEEENIKRIWKKD